MPLNFYLILSAILFCIGLFGVLSRRNIILILMAVELMLNAVNINLVAFSRYVTPNVLTGEIFAIFVITVAVAEICVALAIVLSLYKTRETIVADKINLLKW